MQSIHNMHVGAMNGALYVVFDPPWWKAYLWFWWIYKAHLYNHLVSLWYRITPWVKRRGKPAFATGVIEVRIGNESKWVRVWRDYVTPFAWFPEPKVRVTATRVAATGDPDIQPTDNVHPMERGL